MKIRAVSIVFLILFGSFLYSSELSSKKNTFSSGIEFGMFNIGITTEKYSFGGYSHESMYKGFLGIGIAATSIGTVFAGGGIALVVCGTLFQAGEMLKAMLGGGITLIVLGALLLIIGLPCLIYGAIKYSKLIKEEKVSMFLDMSGGKQNIGLSIRL